MPRRAAGRAPSWDALYEIAAAQQGYFALAQAVEAGYSRQLLQYYVRIGKVRRSLRGVLRLVHFPPSEREDLVPIWLWSEKQGVFGLETALSIHGLSDVLPSRHDLLVPSSWAQRRTRMPKVVQLLVTDVPEIDRQWIDAVPITTPTRTLRDCVRHHVQPDLLKQAFREAVQLGLISRAQATAIKREAA